MWYRAAVTIYQWYDSEAYIRSKNKKEALKKLMKFYKYEEKISLKDVTVETLKKCCFEEVKTAWLACLALTEPLKAVKGKEEVFVISCIN